MSVGSREVADNRRQKLEPPGCPALLKGGQPCPRLTSPRPLGEVPVQDGGVPPDQLASLPFLVCLSNLIPARLPLKFAVGRKAAREGAGGLACLSHSKSLTGTLLHGRCTPANCTGPGRGLCSPGVTGCLLSLGPTGPPAEGCLTGCRLGAAWVQAVPRPRPWASLLLASSSSQGTRWPSPAHLHPRMAQSESRPIRTAVGGEKPDSAH